MAALSLQSAARRVVEEYRRGSSWIDLQPAMVDLEVMLKEPPAPQAQWPFEPRPIEVLARRKPNFGEQELRTY